MCKFFHFKHKFHYKLQHEKTENENQSEFRNTKPKERKQGKDRCHKKLAVAHRETTWENCGSQKRLTVTWRRTPSHAKVAQQKENFDGRNRLRAMAEQANWKVGLLWKKLRTHHEGERGTKDLGSKSPQHMRKKRASVTDIEGWSLGHLSPLRKKRTTTNGIWKWSPGKQTFLGSGRTIRKSYMRSLVQKSWNRYPRLTAGHGKPWNWPCGVVGLFQNRKRDCIQSRSSSLPSQSERER